MFRLADDHQSYSHPTQVSLYHLLVFGGRTLFGSHPSGSTHLEVISSPVPDDFVCNHYLS